MRHFFISICFVICLLYRFGASAETIFFTYVPSPDGNKIGIFYSREREIGFEEGLGSFESGKVGVYRVDGNVFDSSYNYQWDIPYDLDKDGIQWKDNNCFIFDNYEIKGNLLSPWLFPEDSVSPENKHLVSQPSFYPFNGRYAFWLYDRPQKRNLLILFSPNQKSLDTIYIANKVSHKSLKIGVFQYKIFWLDANSLLFGLFEGNTTRLHLLNIANRNDKVLDTLDWCFYRLYAGAVCYPKKGNLLVQDLKTYEIKTAIQAIKGEFDVGEQGLLFCKGKIIYYRKTQVSEPVAICGNGFAPRWLGNKNSIVYSVRDKSPKAGTMMLIKQLDKCLK
jgi:hypothetical protein